MVTNYQNKIIQSINTALGKRPGPLGQLRPDEDYPWIVFLLEDKEYAINTRHVLHIAALYEIVPYRNAPDYCAGIAWNHDGMACLLDLRLLLGLGDYQSFISQANGLLPTIIVVESEGQRFGLIVDRVMTINYFRDASIPVISLDSFCRLDFGEPNIKIDWNARIDMGMLAKNLHRESSR